jgi:hypothetical protein
MHSEVLLEACTQLGLISSLKCFPALQLCKHGSVPLVAMRLRLHQALPQQQLLLSRWRLLKSTRQLPATSLPLPEGEHP